MRYAINDESHSTFEDMNDLLLRMRVQREARARLRARGLDLDIERFAALSE